MRIVLTAHASLGSRLLEAILKQGEEVAAVFIPGGDPLKPSPLKTLAEENGIPAHEPAHMKADGVYEAMAACKPELGVLAFVPDIVPVATLNCPRRGTTMYHPSLLPRHRGGSAMNWAIIQGESMTGLSIIWPDAGIDSGPILLQKEVSILPDDTVGSLFFNRLYPMGVDALVEATKLVREGRAPRIPQDESLATYEPLCQEQHAVIDWTKPAAEVYNLIRGTSPRPGATTTCRGEKLKILDSGLISSPPAAVPGEIVLVTGEEFAVACPDGSIVVRQVKPPGSAKISAADFAQSAGLKKGDRLGQP
ncbi:MAG TPA: methionyl-tRNA formyltransferase [Dehalococcoidia bacterium]|nr:methionyl-tRNA formyltransferase [Dehalococcoidia bacterium]